MNKPNFFIVGAPKSGTTALYEYLKKHPEFFMCPMKEPHFFASDVFGKNRAYRIQTLADYLGLFAQARERKRVGECSIAYLGSRSAPKEIKAFNPAARIIIMLRNPVDMMYALHSQHVWDTTEEVVDFQAALKADEKWDFESGQLQRTRLAWLGYRETARYAQQVRRYFDVFGRENVHVIIYDDFASNTSAVYRDTLRFLDVRPDFQPDFPVINSNHRARSMRVQRFLLRRPMVLLRITPPRLRKVVGRFFLRLNTTYGPRPPMDPELRRRLLKEFEPEVEELSSLLGRDLSSWCKAGYKKVRAPAAPSVYVTSSVSK